MKDDDEMIANRDKRPLYHVGQRVRIVTRGNPALNDWEGEVRGVDAVQAHNGYVVSYSYWLLMDNLAHLCLFEDQLKPVEDAWEKPEIPLPEELLRRRDGKPLKPPPGPPNPITKSGFGRSNGEDTQP